MQRGEESPRGILRERAGTDSPSPVILWTLSGYEIWLDQISQQPERTEAGTLIFRFPVATPQHDFRIVRVEVTPEAQDEIRRTIGPSFGDELGFWHWMAHSALADELEQDPSLFEVACLTLEDVTPNEFDMARHWTKSARE